MALTESNPVQLGTKAPNFSLLDTTSNQIKSLQELKGEKATVLMFICNHCPYVIHVNEQLVQLAKDYTTQGVSFIAISSNDVDNYPQDGPEYMKSHAQKEGYPFPYLYDESQEVAKAYDAACTPDFYVFDSELLLTYHGRLDESRPGSGIPVTGQDLRTAINQLIQNQETLSTQIPSMGCNIKWKNTQ